MRLGLQLPSFTYPGGTPEIRARLTDISQAAESAGLDSLWVMDHLFQLPEDTGLGGPEEPMLEAYATLGFLAGATSRLRLGALVGCAPSFASRRCSSRPQLRWTCSPAVA